MTDPEADVPYGEDFHDPAVAAAWAEGVMRKRPWRSMIFEHFVAIVGAAPAAQARILELGSGPGFLAEQLLTQCPITTNLNRARPLPAQFGAIRRAVVRGRSAGRRVAAGVVSSVREHRCHDPVQFIGRE